MIKWTSESFESTESAGERTEKELASTRLQWDNQGLLRGLGHGMDTEAAYRVLSIEKQWKAQES